MIGAGLLLLLVLVSLLGPWLDLPDPTRGNLRARMAAPTWSWFSLGAHPLGADQLGRDILSRIIAGSQVTLLIAGSAVILGGAVGTLLGLVSGYFGGLFDRLLMRLVDIQLALPLMLLALMIVAAMGPSLTNLIIVLALVSWVRYARIVRGQVLAVKEREFVLAARSIGTPSSRIILRHILPNVLAPVMVAAALGVANAIITESVVSFLGQGFQSDFSTWGSMLNSAYYNQTYPMQMVWPGLAISLTVLSVNYVGDGLRDALDPRIRGR